MSDYDFASSGLAEIFLMPRFNDTELIFHSKDGRLASHWLRRGTEPFLEYAAVVLNFGATAKQDGTTLGRFRTSEGLPANYYLGAQEYMTRSGLMDYVDWSPEGLLARDLAPVPLIVDGVSLDELWLRTGSGHSFMVLNTSGAFGALAPIAGPLLRRAARRFSFQTYEGG